MGKLKLISFVESHVDVENPKRLLWGDAKTQVTVNLDIYNGETVLSVDTVVLSMAYNKTEITLEELRVHFEKLLRKTFNLPNGTKVLINPSGAWTDSYGAYGDAGLTGRKIVADQYGGFVAVGGGSLSSKDLTKVDRSATYAARNIALDILDKFESVKDVEVQLAYAIGVAEPVSITTKITPTKRIATNDLTDYLAARVQDYVEYSYDLTPKGIIERLNFSPCEYYELSKGCHFRSGTYIGKWRERNEN
jgi:S-adenosylmethionine synthetase